MATNDQQVLKRKRMSKNESWSDPSEPEAWHFLQMPVTPWEAYKKKSSGLGSLPW